MYPKPDTHYALGYKNGFEQGKKHAQRLANERKSLDRLKQAGCGAAMLAVAVFVAVWPW